VLEWLFGRRAARDGDGAEGPRPLAEPRAAAASPPEAAARPGVTVHPATSAAIVGAGARRSALSRLGSSAGVPAEDGHAWAALLLTGERRGDVLFLSDAPAGTPAGEAALLDGARGRESGAPERIAGDALTGEPVTGVTGARVLARTSLRAVLRFGPPPAARWAVRGLRSVAVFRGKLTLVDGEEGRDVAAGEVALVADPSATLRVQAGNDAAVAVAFAAPDVTIRLE